MRVGRWKVLAVLSLILAWIVPAQGPNYNQDAHYALVRALADGTPRIDRTMFETAVPTKDFAVFHGHRYAAKAPGLALWTIPAFLALDAAGGAKASGNEFRILWFLGLWATVLPAAVLFLLVRKVVDGIVPGYGTITATTLGVATLILPFASIFFAHALTATLGFAAFALLWHDRHAGARALTVALAGVLAGLAITVELPAVILAAALACYLLSRRRPAVRMLRFGVGALAGVTPLLLFNQWAFGSVAHLSYAGAEGNRTGLFGVATPSFHVASELLFSRIGLLRLAPVLAVAVVGLAGLYRRGYRAEALLVAGLSLAYLVFNSGYATPFGGYSPGPRFLVPIIPFLALALAPMFERLPVTTLVLGAASALLMSVITVTNPLLATTGGWFARLRAHDFVPTAFGFDGASMHFQPLFGLLLLLAAVFAVLATPWRRPDKLDAFRAALALAVWLLVASVSPTLADDGGTRLVLLYAAVAVGGSIVFALPRVVRRRRGAAVGPALP